MVNQTKPKNAILADGRWSGRHGIGRFSSEILGRLTNTDIITHGPNPLSFKNFIWQATQLHRKQNHYRVFFTPGFNPIYHSNIPYVLTVCDLIYLHTPGLKGCAKKVFFETLVKSSIKNAFKIFTISEYSKKSILEWTKIPAEKIINVGCGISEIFKVNGPKFNPGYPYLLHVGNTKSHKNTARLVKAFAAAIIDPTIKLIFTGQLTSDIAHIIQQESLQHRIVFSNALSENELANYYRGATALVFPSLFEGFGLPILEAMACGIPVLTSNSTSCPEVAGKAAVLVHAYETDSLKEGIEKIVNNSLLRDDLMAKGLERANHYSWDKTAALAQTALNEALGTEK